MFFYLILLKNLLLLDGTYFDVVIVWYLLSTSLKLNCTTNDDNNLVQTGGSNTFFTRFLETAFITIGSTEIIYLLIEAVLKQ